MQQQTLPSKLPAEQLKVGFEFASLLAAGETLSSGTVTSVLYSGTDASPSAVISGAASISGTQLVQLLIGGVTGNIYNLTASATTSAGKTLNIQGLLTITQGIM